MNTNKLYVNRGTNGSAKAAHVDNSIIERVNPDVAFLILETVMKMILTIGGVAQISDLKVSMPRPDEMKELRTTLAKLKVAIKEVKHTLDK